MKVSENMRDSHCDRDPKDLHGGMCMSPQEGVQFMNRIIDLSD